MVIGLWQGARLDGHHVLRCVGRHHKDKPVVLVMEERKNVKGKNWATRDLKAERNAPERNPHSHGSVL